MGPAPGADGYMAPETAVFVLEGNVYGNPKFPDGQLIHTGEIVGELDLEKRKAQTKTDVENSEGDFLMTYELGKPNQGYLQFLLDGDYPSGQVMKDW